MTALVSGAALTLPVAASASPTAGKPSAAGYDSVESSFIASVGSAAIANQDALSRFRGWMLGQAGFATSGYIGSIDDLAHKATTLMWSGPGTPFLRAVIAHGARQGITVSVRHRKYSLRQLERAALTTWHQAAAGQWSGFKVSGPAGQGAARDHRRGAGGRPSRHADNAGQHQGHGLRAVQRGRVHDRVEDLAVNDYVCTGGGNSGEHCNWPGDVPASEITGPPPA